jgi:hypothetical protein
VFVCVKIVQRPTTPTSKSAPRGNNADNHEISRNYFFFQSLPSRGRLATKEKLGGVVGYCYCLQKEKKKVFQPGAKQGLRAAIKLEGRLVDFYNGKFFSV